MSIRRVKLLHHKAASCCIRVCGVCLLVGCLTSQQHASVSQGRIFSDNFTCCHTEIEVADPTFYLTQSQYTDTGPTSPSADPITPGAWQGSHWSANFEVTGMTRPRKIPAQAGFEPWIFRSRGGRLNHKATEAAECVGVGSQPAWCPSSVNSVSARMHEGQTVFYYYYYYFFFFAFPSYISGVHHFWVRFFAYVTVFLIQPLR